MRTTTRLRLAGVLLTAMLALLPAGCSAQTSASGKAGRQDKGAPPAKGGLREFIARQKVPEELHELGLFYNQFFNDFNRGPDTTEEFRSYIGHDAAKLSRAIKERYYTLVCKVNRLPSVSILAFEREADPDGKRWVVNGHAAVKKMDEDELNKALEAK